MPVASFCASETAETGRIANGREQGDHVSRRRLRPATSIQSSAGNNIGKASDGTSRNRFFAQNGGEKALNRCDARALQRKDLEWRLKERPYSLRTVGYGWVEMGDGGQKRVAWDGSKESFGQRKSFWFEKMRDLQVQLEKFSKIAAFLIDEKGFFRIMQGHLEKKGFCLRQKLVFSAHARPTDKEKLFTNPLRQHFSTMPKLTCSHKFHPRIPTVSLQQNIPFSKLRSLASDVQHPFRTDSNPHRRYPERLKYPAWPVT